MRPDSQDTLAPLHPGLPSPKDFWTRRAERRHPPFLEASDLTEHTACLAAPSLR